jgi:thermitase
MGFFACTRFDVRQVSVLAVALLWAILLLSLAPGAKGQAAAHQKVDKDPSGAPYVAGELLVAYEPGTSENAEQAVIRGSGGRTAEDLPGRMRLVSFPGTARVKSQEARERALQRKLEHLRNGPGVEAADYNHLYRASFIPDDPRFGGQWGLGKVRFSGAWNDARGSGAKIAIVDSGIDLNHPDIGKIVGQRDLVAGDAVANDPYGHGTHVAGIAAALTGNGMGVAGGCPACNLLIARVLDANGNTDAATLAEGIDWSANNGADVINLSLDGPANDTVQVAVNNASAGGTVVVAAAGNQGTTAPRYPAAYSRVIAVSATNENDRLAGFSSRGSWVDLAAPGTNILSTRAGGGYNEASGTSEAAPFVSALAGLLTSEGKTASEIRQRMQSTATDLGPTGKDPSFGHGRINANRAVP